MNVMEKFKKSELSKVPGGLSNFQCECPGGGRIAYDTGANKIQIYGYSQSYGLANHSVT